MPVTVTITEQPSGAVVATGGDQLAHELLKHAGFTRHADWHGIRFRLPTTMPRETQTEVAGSAVRMLSAARYEVVAPASLSPDAPSVEGQFGLGKRLLHLADRLRGAQSGAELSGVLVELLDREQGVLIRLQEAAGEQVTDLDPDAYELSDRLGAASDLLYSVNGDLEWVVVDVAKVAPVEGAVSSAARTSSPAAVRSALPPAPSVEVGPASGVRTSPAGRGR
ncbi:hypothetical protein [Streptomyces acidiscabies]|uniref:Uncharacterized protein n=1 Tax=Streptomyces acidiscabies TaxID=42234 RepID=A0AAP6BLZ4_9ACTN|nr:hypothetical protein [Streptomyces acidiscabies]MBP5936703.1 hypothetical protein [Streptomyces sp. LBUM 1476]MBZ3915299.1 hypothetical protein [Streptomyces acidiscabies]MDX2967256.1 hypothetical protein [Streptomyces acidiscabies]MDX3026058.1 hypothetical protein [Streptomyces acidiscabies]MDX3797033.1 hypothetical protein [Streptomyces acidiscabies]